MFSVIFFLVLNGFHFIVVDRSHKPLPKLDAYDQLHAIGEAQFTMQLCARVRAHTWVERRYVSLSVNEGRTRFAKREDMHYINCRGKNACISLASQGSNSGSKDYSKDEGGWAKRNGEEKNANLDVHVFCSTFFLAKNTVRATTGEARLHSSVVEGGALEDAPTGSYGSRSHGHARTCAPLEKMVSLQFDPDKFAL